MPKLVHWTPEKISLLGRIPDRQVADQMGVSGWHVRRTRKKLGIPAHSSVIWIPEDIRSELGTQPDTVIAKRLGLSANRVAKWRVRLGIPAFSRVVPLPELTAEAVSLLGCISDAAFGRRFGLTQWRAGAIRRSMGIPPSRQPLTWTKDDLSRLGHETDSAL